MLRLPIFVLALAGVSGQAHGTEWRQAAYAATRSSYNPRETAIDASNVATLVERWRAPGIGAKRSPVVGGGRVFVGTSSEIIALALADGSELWRKSIDEEQCCGLGDPVLTPDGKVTAELGWIGGGGTAVFDRPTGTFTYAAVFHGGNINRAVVGSDVYSIGFGYGSGGPLGYTLEPYGGLIYFGDFSAGPVSGPAVRGARAFATVGSTLVALDLGSCPNPVGSFCGPLWFKSLGGIGTTPVAFGSGVVVAAQDGSLQVYDADGDLQWSAMLAAGVGHAPAVARGRIFLPTDRGLIVAFDSDGCGAATCSPVQRFRLGKAATDQPVVAGNVLYAGTKDGRILGFAADGCGTAVCQPLWDVDLAGGAIVAGPIVINGTVIAGTKDGQLVAFGLPQAE